MTALQSSALRPRTPSHPVLPLSLLFFSLLFLTVPAHAAWQSQQSGTTANLRGIHAVSPGIAWASGSEGTVLRTEDGGYLWQRCAVPPGAEKLDFRGIWAWDATNAIVMASGPGPASRLYKTSDGCNSWRLVSTNTDEKGFWDAIAFVGPKNGLLVGDPVDGRFVVAHTTDAGEHWQRSPSPQLQANAGESIFAASNSALFAPSSIAAVFGTGGLGGPRIFTGVTLLGEKWRSVPVPLAKGSNSSGVFSIAFRDGQHALALGGDYEKPAETAGTVVYTDDGGISWKSPAGTPPRGYRSAVAYHAASKAWIAAGTTGTDFSLDDGRTWQRLDDGDWNALSLPFVVGPKGRVGKLASLSPDPVKPPEPEKKARPAKSRKHHPRQT